MTEPEPDREAEPVADQVANQVVVLVGREPDADALGAVARELEDAGRRAAVFLGDVTDPTALAALHEMLDELFPT